MKKILMVVVFCLVVSTMCACVEATLVAPGVVAKTIGFATISCYDQAGIIEKVKGKATFINEEKVVRVSLDIQTNDSSYMHDELEVVILDELGEVVAKKEISLNSSLLFKFSYDEEHPYDDEKFITASVRARALVIYRNGEIVGKTYLRTLSVN